MNIDKKEIESRKPVWEALSTLFLDTDTSLSRTYRSRLLAESKYSIEDIKRILIDEVYPVCRGNLSSIAGEWAGFDPEWLEQNIMRRLNSLFRVFHFINIGYLTVPLSLEWKETIKEVILLRNAGQINRGAT